MIALLLTALTLNATPVIESDYWAVEHFTSPDGEILEVGGMDFLPDGRLVVTTRRGQLWIIENALTDDVDDAVFHLGAEGLHEGLGLKVVGDDILVVQRGELSRLRDLDGDSTFETIDTITQDWGMTGNYHEFAFGLPQDEAGNVYVTLNVGFWNPEWWHGKSRAPLRGCVLRIAPDGTVTRVATGVRSPCGLGIDMEGRLLVTDNQGDWMAACPIMHVRDGDFFGHPASLRWTDDHDTETELSSSEPPDVDRTPPAIWIPYSWSRSTGNLEPDRSQGAFGPFAGQLFVSELTNGMVIRAQLEEVDGVTQGACFKFMQRIGSACRVAFAPDGTMIVGFTNRGWGGFPPGHGLARIRYNGIEPMEMKEIHIQPDGFEIDFTKPVADDVQIEPDDVQMTAYDYNWWWEYGSPEQHVRNVPVTKTALSQDRRTLQITAPIEAGSCVRIRLDDVLGDGDVPLLHNEVSYTINRIPGAGKPDVQVARRVQPPASKNDRDAGWMRLTWGSVSEQWDASGWNLAEAELDPDDPTRFTTRPGNSAVVNNGESPSDYVSRGQYGDMEFQIKFILPEQSVSKIRLLDGVVIELKDNSHLPGYPTTCGALVLPDGTRIEPDTNAYQGAGLWHELKGEIVAPKLTTEGRVFEPAVLRKLTLDGTTLHQDITIEGIDVDRGHIEILSGPGMVGFADVRAKPMNIQWPQDDSWSSILPDAEFTGWTQTSGNWDVVDGILKGEGAGGLILNRRIDQDFELRARVRINEGGWAAIIPDAFNQDGNILGPQASVNNSVGWAPRTASLGSQAIRTELLAPATTFQYRVTSRHVEEGIHLEAFVNGIKVNEWVDELAKKHNGSIALLMHTPDTRFQVESLELRMLDR
ncbi:MAG: DUF1080 domain-containing protein [Phycisphaerales bacterium]|nr:DUF1080 domain-containing protein [Phycisphaerales bacterium]